MTVINHFKMKTGTHRSFRNESHISYRNGNHKKFFSRLCWPDIEKKVISKGRSAQSFFKGMKIISKYHFKKIGNISFRKVNHQSYKSHIQIKVIVKCNLILIYNYSIWLLKWKYAGHNTPTVKGVYELSFLTDSSLTRVYLPCSSRLFDVVSEPFLSDFVQ